MIFVIGALLSGVGYLFVSYPPVRDGKLYLNRANSTSVLTRDELGVHFIEAESILMAAYT